MKVYVSTDSEEIAEVAKQWGAEVLWRPQEISGDANSSEEALLHALDQIELKHDINVDLIVFPQATSPLRQSIDFEKAINIMEVSCADSLFSCSRLEDICIWEQRGSQMISVSYDYRNRKPRQLESGRYLENGSFYMVLPELLRKEKNRLGGRIEIYEMEEWKSYQIDYLDDIVIVEQFLCRLTSSLEHAA